MIKIDISIDAANRGKIDARLQHLLAASIELRLDISC